jgi:nucleoside permease NupC
MNLGNFINFSLLSCGLVGVLMVVVAALAFLRNRRKISNRTGIIIIVLVLMLALIALSVSEF